MTLTATQPVSKNSVAKNVSPRPVAFSSFLTALLIVALLDLSLSFKHPLEKVPTVNLDRSEYYVGFKSYLLEAKKDPAAKIVLLGSSILMQPLMEKEADFLKQPIKPFEHRRLASVEALLADQKPPTALPAAHVYCLAMGGEMTADGYFMLKKSIEAKQIPRSVIIGTAPRDFQCNVVPDITNSDSFKLWTSAADLPEVRQASHASFEQFGDFVMGRFSQLFRYRADYAKFLLFKIKSIVDKICPLALFEKMDGQGNKGLFKKGVLAEDTPGSITTLPGMAMAHRERGEAISEYTRNYLPVNQSQVNTQFEFLGKTLDLCKKYDIQAFVVEMPLSKTNRDILPATFYSNFKNQLQSVVSAHGDKLIDLQDASWDDESNFIDTVHVNPANVNRLIDSIFGRCNRP